MKTLKSKIENELHLHEANAMASPAEEMDENTLEEVYKLSKTLFYVEKACEIMHGKNEASPMSERNKIY